MKLNLKKPLLRLLLFIIIATVLSGQALLAQQLAFPGAEGFGAYAEGGRGGDVYYVTNLNDSGAGSLREGISSASGPRTIVFAVSGLIQLQSDLAVNNDYITIAGQTAPGDGICLRDRAFKISADHLIVRFMRSRLGDDGGVESDAISITSGNNIIMDHCSASWSVDECFSCSTSSPVIDNVTVQWSIISEALENSIHSKGAHSYGALIRGCYGVKYSYHHNLFASCRSRMPRPGNYDENPYNQDPLGLQFDFRNNLIYNWGGSRPGYDADTLSVCRMNFVGNYAKHGPESDSGGYLYDPGCRYFMAYFSENFFNGSIPGDPYTLVDFSGWTSQEQDDWKQSVPFSTGPIITDTAQDAYDKVLDHAGASFVRDSVDARIVNDVINGTGAIIDHEEDVGDWPDYNTYGVPTDTDLDGMPDNWEITAGLNINDASDRNGYDLDPDYTNLEVYLNQLAALAWEDDVTPPDPDPMTWATAPYATGDNRISMTATTATDASGVEYYFTCTAGGGNDSGWQDSTTYEDIGLTPSTQYTYTVTARDKSSVQNTTAASTAESATTDPPDTTPPTPDPMTWASVPAATGSSSISMTATTASDDSGVEYYFTCTAGGGNDSGWQDSTTYEDTGLTPQTQYTYTVTAVDKSAGQNMTAASTAESATTDAFLADWTQSMELTFAGYTGSTTLVNFPVLVTLDDTKINYQDFLAAGADLRFSTTQGAELIPHEIEVWNPSGISYIWVRVSSLSSSTDSIWMHWDNPNASAPTDSDQVWSENYAGAWHLAGTFDDASPNQNNGTNNGTSSAAGLAGDGVYFDGADYVSLPTGIGSSDLGSVTHWVKTSHDFTEFGMLFHATSDTGANGGGSHEELHTNFTVDPFGTTNTVRGFVGGVEGERSETYSSGTLNNGAWHHLALTWDSLGQVKLYVDGSLNDSVAHIAPIFNFDVSVNLGKPEQDVRYYIGDMDEVRLSSVVRSADWVEASYLSQQPSSTFIDYTTAPPDTDPPTPDPMTFDVLPYPTGPTSIAMTATTATDQSGVEYYFTCTAGGGNDSGWQDATLYEDTSLTPDTQYTYTVTARDKSANQNQTAPSTGASATTDPFTGADDTANADIPVQGNIGGSYADTQSSDNTYESITEVRQGNPVKGFSSLEHKWTINVTGGTTVTFYVEAYETASPDGDDFVFAYSTDDASYTDMLTVTKTSDDDTYQSYALPASTSGTVYIRVTDTDSTQGSQDMDTVYVDDMYIHSGAGAPDTDPPTPDPATFESPPAAVSDTEITMTATTGSDATGPVQYFFEETSGNPGGSDSEWTTDPVYNDTGLTASTQYTYTVQMRDSAPTPNVGTASTPASATTNDPPPALPWTEGFETGGFIAGGWITTGSPTVSNKAEYSGTYGAKIPGTASIETAISTVGFTGIHVKYRRQTKGLDSGENLVVEWYDGSAWNPLETVQNAAYTDGLQDKTCSTAADNNANFKIRFSTNANSSNEYAYIDDIEVTGSGI